MSYLKIDKTKLINLEYALKREIIRTNRSGAYACTTIIDCNTRKYHGLLICPLPDVDGGRHVLISGLDETIIQHDQEFNLGLHKYAGDHYEPKGHKYIRDFSSSPIPRLEYRVGDVVLSKEMLLIENESQLLIKYTLIEAKSPTRIRFKPFLAFRNIHALSKANMDINTKYQEIENGISSNLYAGYPDLRMQFNKQPEFVPAPDWYYNIEYKEDHQRGYDYKEDLYVPGFFELAIKKGESIIFSAALKKNNPTQLKRKFNAEIKKKIPRNNLNTCLANTIQQFFVQNNNQLEIIAGFPWLPIRSRDALIALPGLTLPFDDEKNYVKVLKSIVNKFKGHLLQDITEQSNSGFPIDIPLWFIWSVQLFSLRYGSKNAWRNFGKQVQTILTGYLKEQDLFELNENGLLYAFENTYPNSWMNAQHNNKAIVDRKGFLVEVNSLWYNAINFVLEFHSEIKSVKFINTLKLLKQKIEVSYISTFWNESTLCLNDFAAIDETNTQIRPNQIFATSLPYTILSKPQILAVLDKVKSELLTSFGIRSLSPVDENYNPIYEGDHFSRENAAFNGSVWPWLLTSYFEGRLKTSQITMTINEAKTHLKNFEDELKSNGMCLISELYHGNPPQKAKGAISYAKNTGELVRLKYIIDNLS